MAIAGYLHVTAAGAGTKSGADWANAMDWAALVAAGISSGYVVFIKGNQTYTQTANVNFSTAGTASSPNAFIGVKTGTTNEGAAITYSDWELNPANFPFIDGATYTLTVANYFRVENLFHQSSAASQITCGSYCVFRNCKLQSDKSTDAGQYVVVMGNRSKLINCEIDGNNHVYGVYDNAGQTTYLYNKIHSIKGIGLNATGSSDIAAIGNLFVNISLTAIDVTTAVSCKVINNSFYACGASFSKTSGYGHVILNNICEANTANGFKATTAGNKTDIDLYDGNHGDDARDVDMWLNVDDTTVFKDNNATAGDPLFVNTSLDWSLGSSSPCRASAMDISLGVGSPVKHGNKGAWQGMTNIPASSGGGKRRMSGTRCECKGGVCG